MTKMPTSERRPYVVAREIGASRYYHSSGKSWLLARFSNAARARARLVRIPSAWPCPANLQTAPRRVARNRNAPRVVTRRHRRVRQLSKRVPKLSGSTTTIVSKGARGGT
jgi:hypothetical protein